VLEQLKRGGGGKVGWPLNEKRELNVTPDQLDKKGKKPPLGGIKFSNRGSSNCGLNKIRKGVRTKKGLRGESGKSPPGGARGVRTHLSGKGFF